MTNSDESAFAWSLASEFDYLYTRAQRTWMCVALGAGDYNQVIEGLLRTMSTNDMTLPVDLVDTALDWVARFRGAATEDRLRKLVKRAIPADTPV